jgi:hypothetical protein
MTRRMSRLIPLLLSSGALMMANAPATTAAQSASRDMPFDVAELFFELNDTDGDLGIHGSIDGGPWTMLEIEAPGDRTLLNLVARGSLRRQGMTELFFESAEPGFDELAPAAFFRRFPEGRYEISGRAQEGGELESTAVVSHVLPAPADNITLSGVPAAEDCDVTPLPTVNPPVVIDWDPVTTSHEEIGRRGRIRISRYQLVVEHERVTFSVDLPPTVTRFEVPTGVTDLGKEFKFEILARATNNNNTAVESCFLVP